MNKIIYLFLFLIISSVIHAQYKDASEYFKARDVLYNEDDILKPGYSINLTKAEVKVNDYLKYLQQDYIQKSGANFPPAHYFYKYRHMIDSSLTYRVIRMLPKGALLHTHLPATGSPEWLVKTASYYDNCYMYAGTDTINNVYGQMKFFTPGKEPNDWVSLKSLRENDNDFDNKLFKMLTFDEDDYNSPVVWVEFEKIFTRMSGLINYYPVFTAFNKNVIDSLIADNIQHFETRTFLSGVYDLNGKVYSQEECLLIHKNILDTIRMTNSDFTMKLIYSGYRGWSNAIVIADMIKAIELRKKYPDFLMGYDLVGEEDKGHRTDYFINEFLKTDSLKKVYGVDLPFYFHDGESTLPSDNNLYDAVLLGTKRIGHGINLFRFPSLFPIVKDNSIALEVCPLSNQILGYVSNLRMHPASEYINLGLPVTISSDDPQIFNYTGVSYDFWSAFMAWELDLRQLKSLIINSITYSTMTETEKSDAMDVFNKRWYKFIEEVTKIMTIK